MKTRQELKLMAKEAMQAQRKTAILLMLVMVLKVLVLGVFNDIVVRRLGLFPFQLVNVAVTLALIVLAVNMMREYLKISRGEPTHVMALYPDFKVHLGRKLGGMLWMFLWVMIWAMIAVPVFLLAMYLIRSTGRGMRIFAILLLGPFHLVALIPAIIKGLEYSMTAFVLADCPDVPAREALNRSKRIMKGRRGELFVLILSFAGWMALSALTLGVLYVVYVGPYYYLTIAGFYDDRKDQVPEEDVVVKAVLIEKATE